MSAIGMGQSKFEKVHVCFQTQLNSPDMCTSKNGINTIALMINWTKSFHSRFLQPIWEFNQQNGILHNMLFQYGGAYVSWKVCNNCNHVQYDKVCNIWSTKSFTCVTDVFWQWQTFMGKQKYVQAYTQLGKVYRQWPYNMLVNEHPRASKSIQGITEWVLLHVWFCWLASNCLSVNCFCGFNITSVACAVGPSVTMSSTDFSFQNLVFWNLFEFSAAEITLKSISPTFWIQILSTKFH